jgi:hypothetical protein
VTVVDIQIPEHVRAVKAHLIDRSIPAEIGHKPAGVGWTGTPGQSAFTGYAIVRRVGAIESRNQHMEVRFTEARPAVQITCVGATEDQANEVHEAVMVAMLDGTLAIPGRDVQRVIPEVSISTTKDPDETPAVWFGGARYRLWTLPGDPPPGS